MTKAEQRKETLAARRALSAEERRRASAVICARLLALPELREAKIVLSYRTLPDEVDLRALEAELDARLVYPRCLGSGVMEAWQPEGPWSRGPYGIEEPDTAASRLVEPEEIDAVLVPCVGFDGALRRLGHGAGYYDRYLPRCTKALCIGVAFEAQRLERVVTGEHDRSLDRIVTEREIIKP